MNNNIESQVIQAVNDITALEAQLASKRAELRALLGTNEVPKRKAPKAKSKRNVSQEVLRALQNPKVAGMTAPQLIYLLGLNDREGAVRGALKKHQKAGRLRNHNGFWIACGSVIPVPKEKAPTTSVAEPLEIADLV
jgi:hypothetical protein